MNIRLTAFSAALIACAVPAWASASTLPAYETYSAAADGSTNLFNAVAPAYTPQVDVTTVSGATAQIAGTSYMASASTALGSNHAYASASSMPDHVLSVGSFSGWYDQVTITGGTGPGTAYFTVQLAGAVDVGAFAGGAYYGLYASPLHPAQLVDTLNIVDPAMPPTNPWALYPSQVRTISTYTIVASPYNEPSLITDLFAPLPPQPDLGSVIPATPSLPGDLLGGDTGMGFPTPDLTLTPGTGQDIHVTLHGTLNFTYGEAFYLIGGLGTHLPNLDAFQVFCSFDTECPTNPPVDGTGATTLDFSNSANLVSIGLPKGATASFASGAAYNVTTVPEPGEWAMLLAGLALVGRRARRRSC